MVQHVTRKYGSTLKYQTAIVKDGVRLRYIEGDTEPPPPMPPIRNCRTCGQAYEVVTGKNCNCWAVNYERSKHRK